MFIATHDGFTDGTGKEMEQDAEPRAQEFGHFGWEEIGGGLGRLASTATEGDGRIA